VTVAVTVTVLRFVLRSVHNQDGESEQIKQTRKKRPGNEKRWADLPASPAKVNDFES